MNENIYHIPALLDHVVSRLDIQPGGTYVDATYGGGGHSRAIADMLSGEGKLYAFDQDDEALARAGQDDRIVFVHGNFKYITNFLDFYGVKAVDGVLADLGVSFHHFDDPARGFSFRYDGPLDMRMNRGSALTAARLIAESGEEELADIFHIYGELKSSKKLAKAIVKARQEKPLLTIPELLGAVRPLIDPRQEKKELAQLFQALRITVNDETSALKALLSGAVEVLKPGGRLAIITYHSLEDRLVKNFMKTGNFQGRQEKDFYGKSLSPMKLLTNKPIIPDDDEIERNPRSRSAKLRVAVKL